MMEYSRYWIEGRPWRSWLGTVVKYADLWHAIDAHVRVPETLTERIEATSSKWRLLVIAEDWCGDAVNLVPPVAALGERARNLEVRVIGRDLHPELMDAHLTDGLRAIPVAILLDASGRMRGWWGPRPATLQEWFERELRGLTSSERYPLLRGWYARDRGRTTLEEIVTLIERAAAEDQRLRIPA